MNEISSSVVNYYSNKAVVQSPSRVRLFATPWTAAHQASLSLTISRSLSKFMSTASVMPSSHLILCCPLLLLPSTFPASGSFPMNQLSGDKSTGASASAWVLPVNIQDWFLLRLSGLTLQFKGLSRVLFLHHSLKAPILWHSAFFIV